jgi:hypothetical protein
MSGLSFIALPFDYGFSRRPSVVARLKEMLAQSTTMQLTILHDALAFEPDRRKCMIIGDRNQFSDVVATVESLLP